jgi:hypothetical protein
MILLSLPKEFYLILFFLCSSRTWELFESEFLLLVIVNLGSYHTQNHWACGLCLSSGILNNEKTQRFRIFLLLNPILFASCTCTFSKWCKSKKKKKRKTWTGVLSSTSPNLTLTDYNVLFLIVIFSFRNGYLSVFRWREGGGGETLTLLGPLKRD